MKPTLELLVKEHRIANILKTLAEIYEDKTKEAERYKSRIVFK